MINLGKTKPKILKYALAYAVFCYLIGCICFGYYLTRFFAGKDLKEFGSRSLGATNTSRVLGKWGFVVTFVLDFLKGYLVILGALRLEFTESWLFFFSLMVVAGHIWPLQLGFKGGKGVSTFGGTLMAINFLVAVPVAIFFLPLYLIFRKFTIAGIFTLIIIPPFLAYQDYSVTSISLNILLILTIVYAHKQNLREYFQSKKDIAF